MAKKIMMLMHSLQEMAMWREEKKNDMEMCCHEITMHQDLLALQQQFMPIVMINIMHNATIVKEPRKVDNPSNDSENE